MTEPIPPRYRRLLLLHPRRWRRENGDVVLATQMEQDAAVGRKSPSFADRVRFAVNGITARSGVRRSPRPSAPVRPVLFDQTNGLVPSDDPVPRISEAASRRIKAEESGFVLGTVWFSRD